jgi:hypothetical protein
MLSSQKKKLLDELIASASKEELAWINGYMSGILLGGEIPQATAVKPAVNKLMERRQGIQKNWLRILQRKQKRLASMQNW